MSDFPRSKNRLLGLSLLALTVALAACSPKAGTDASPTLAALDSSESALLPPLPAVQPMQAGPAAPLRLAPAAAALPRGRTLGYARASGNDRYAWIDRANRINETIGDAPPDYGFDYQDGVQPYGWESSGGYRTYAEAVDGGYRTYYYDPGASEPYLVRDPSYSYGYSDGQLVTVYDRGGHVLDEQLARQQADYAARYYDRGRTMYAAAESRQRRGVTATRWANQREVISTQRAEWTRTQATTPEWRGYRNDHAVADQRLIEERAARAQAARQFSTWQAQGFRGQTPVMYDQPQPARHDGAGYGRRQPDQQQAQLMEQQRQQQAVLQQQARQRDTAVQQQVMAQRQAAAQRQAVAQQQDAAQRLATVQRQVAAQRQDAAQRQGVVQRQDAARRQDAAQQQVVAQRHDAAQRQVAAQQQDAVKRQDAAQRQDAAKRQVAAQRQAAAQQARQVQLRNAAALAKSAQIRQQQDDRASMQQRQQQQRVVREQQAAGKQVAEQQRKAIQHQSQIDTAKRVGEARQNAVNAAQAQKAAQQRAVQERAVQERAAQARPAKNMDVKDRPGPHPRPGADPG